VCRAPKEASRFIRAGCRVIPVPPSALGRIDAGGPSEWGFSAAFY
jgi:hypothetical protein